VDTYYDVLEELPTYDDAWLAIAKVYYHDQDFKNAMRILDRIILRSGPNAEVEKWKRFTEERTKEEEELKAQEDNYKAEVDEEHYDEIAYYKKLAAEDEKRRTAEAPVVDKLAQKYDSIRERRLLDAQTNEARRVQEQEKHAKRKLREMTVAGRLVRNIERERMEDEPDEYEYMGSETTLLAEFKKRREINERIARMKKKNEAEKKRRFEEQQLKELEKQKYLSKYKG